MYRLFCMIACIFDRSNPFDDLLFGLSSEELDQILADTFASQESRGGPGTRQRPVGLTPSDRKARRAFFAMPRKERDRYLDLLWVLAQEPLNLDATPMALEFNERFYP